MKKKSAYIEKLKHPNWQKKRLQILERDEWVCQSCFDTESTLHVHHKYYETGKNPWEYPDGALITLCQDCHEDETESLREYEPLLMKQFKRLFMADDFREIACGMSFAETMWNTGQTANALAWMFRNEEIIGSVIDAYTTHRAQLKASLANEKTSEVQSE